VTFAVLNLCYKFTNQIEFYRINGMYRIISSLCYQRKNGETFAKPSPCVNPSFRLFKARALGSSPSRLTISLIRQNSQATFGLVPPD